MYSSYFNALFYGNFSEQSQPSVELKDIDYDDFVTLLRVSSYTSLHFRKYH